MQESIYNKLFSEYTNSQRKINQQLRLIAWLRFLFFISAILAIIYLPKVNIWLSVIGAIVLFIAFLLMVKRYISKEKEKQFFTNLITINKNEIKASEGDYSMFNNGSQYLNPLHDFSFDLDLFGKQSFFQFLNRTSTENGRHKLANFLNSNETNPEIIVEKQEALQELAEELNWRQHFAAKGMTKNDASDFEILHDWSGTEFQIKNKSLIKIALFIIPAISLSGLLLYIFSLIPWGAFLLLVFVQWGIFAAYSKKISLFYQLFGSRSKILSGYIDMLHHIENKAFKSKLLVELSSKLKYKNKSASHITNELSKIISEFDYRQNIIVGFVLNSLLLWDLRCIYRLSNWHAKYHHLLDEWFDVIACFDAHSSFANYNYNHKKWCLPELASGNFTLEAEMLGHPLINHEKRIDNDFKISDWGKLAIITGANMAGKSTFLRTVGTNMILALNGCLVCAKSFKFSPIMLFTNMRTTDNLMNDESYFYAELLRLQQMLERIRAGENLFIIIDEMLKGTNSVDKLNGSKELVKQLIQLGSVGIVATHDLKLTELDKSLPKSIQNQCFEVQLNKDDLSFDYKLREGVTQTMNATFLMKKMGIIH